MWTKLPFGPIPSSFKEKLLLLIKKLTAKICLQKYVSCHNELLKLNWPDSQLDHSDCS